MCLKKLIKLGVLDRWTLGALPYAKASKFILTVAIKSWTTISSHGSLIALSNKGLVRTLLQLHLLMLTWFMILILLLLQHFNIASPILLCVSVAWRIS